MTAALPPDDATLRRFLLGDLPPAELEAVGCYLDEHPSVATTLAALKTDDTLLSALRGPAEASDAPEVAAAVARAAGLVGGETPTESLAPTPIGDATADAIDAAVAAVSDADDADDPLAALAPPEAVGELGRLGGYRVLRLLGRGGMGAVFEGADDRLGRRVALKVMLPALAAKASARQRFLREAKAAAAVEHDHIVPIYQTGEDRGVPFLAMPLLAGQTLDDRLTGGRALPVAEVVRVGREVAEGLAAAHAAGLVHRDIKPSNVWLERTADGAFRRVRILDFGLARSATGADGLTQSGAVLGTPAYMAPEQARGESVDARADLFSLGVVLYHAATGRRPFPGADTFSILTALATTEPPTAASVNPAVPAELSALITRLLAKNPAARPQSARAAADELARLAAALPRDSATQVIGVGAADRSVSGGETTEAFEPTPRRPASRRRWRVAAAVLFLAVVGLAAANGKTIVRVVTNEGELVVEVDDPATEVVVTGGAVELRREEGGKKRVYLVTATKDGEVEVREPGAEAGVVTKKFQLRRGGDVLVKVTAGELAADRAAKTAPAPPATDPDRAAAEYVFARGGEAKVAGRWESVQSPADLPPGPFRLTEAHLWRREGVTDAGVAVLAACPKLATASLGGTGVTDTGLAHLAKLPELTHLSVERTAVTDAGLAHFRGHPGFVLLDLGGTKVTAAGLAHAGDGRRLSVLSLVDLPVGDDDLRRFAPAPDLWTLTLGGTKVTDAALALFAGSKKLGRLDVQRTGVTDVGLAHARAWSGLTDLNLEGTAVTDAGLDTLAGLPSLRALHVRGTKATEAGVMKLAATLPELRIVWDGPTIEPKASSTADPDRRLAEWVRNLGGNWAVEVVIAGNVRHCGPGTPLPAEPFKVRGIRVISEGKQTTLRPEDVDLFRGVNELESVILHTPGVNDQTLPRLIAVLPESLREFSISTHSSRERVGDTALVGLTRLQNLRSLSLRSPQVTDKTCEFIRLHPEASQLVLNPTAITDLGMRHLKVPGAVTRLELPEATGDESARPFLATGKLEYVRLGRLCTPAALPLLAKNPALTTVRSVPRAATDADLIHLKTLASLTHLDLERTQVTGAALPEFHGRALLTGVTLGHTKVADANLRHLKGFPTLRSVGLFDTPVGDAGTVHLADIDTLAEINLNNSAVTDAGLEHLQRAKGLRSLQVNGAGVTATGVKRLAAARPDVRIHWDGPTIEPKASPTADPDRRAAEHVLSLPRDFVIGVQVNDVDVWYHKAADLPAGSVRLTAVNVEWAGKMDDAAFAPFRGCKHVKRLSVLGTQATERGLANFADCRDLEQLVLIGEPITDAAVELFKDRPKLTHLGVQSRNVTDAGLAHFAGRTNLVHLSVAHGRVTDAGAAYFKDNKKLKSLILNGTQVTDAGMAHFAGCADLEVFEAFDTRVGDAGLAHLKGCKKLKRVNLFGLAGVTAAGVAHLKDCTELTSVNLGNTAVGEDVLPHLQNLTYLGYLNLDNTPVTDAGLARLTPLKRLGELHLVRTRVTGAGLARLAECPNLARLNLNGVPLTDADVPDLARLTRLRWLGVRDTRLTAAGVKALAAAMPLCQFESSHGDPRAGAAP